MRIFITNIILISAIAIFYNYIAECKIITSSGSNADHHSNRNADHPRYRYKDRSRYSRIKPESSYNDFGDDEDDFDLTKRQQQPPSDDYGHMRFGKRDEQFDDYGHMRFGRTRE